METLFKTDENFKQLSDADRMILQNSCIEKKASKGDVLFKDGERGEEAYIVKNGLIRLSKKISSGEDITLAMAKRGMIFGEMAVFDIIPRYADAVAVFDAELIVLTKEKFKEIRLKYPVSALLIIDIFLKFLALYLRKTTDRVYGIFDK